ALDPGAARAVLRLARGSGPGALAEHLAGPPRGGAGDTRRAAGARELDRRWLAAWDLARGDGDGEAQARLLRAHDSFRRILSWDGGASASRELAGRALEFVAAGIGERSLRWGGDEGGGRLEMAVFRELAGRSAAGSWTAGVLASWIGGLFRDARGGAALPVYAGERELLGRRTPLAPGETRGILRVHLPREPGFGARDELVVRPILVFHPGGRVELSFPGIAAAPAGTRAFARAAAPSLRRLLGLIAVGAGPVLASRVVRKLPPELRARLTADPAASDVRPALPGAGDLLAAFEECSFDRNRQRADEGNPELIALILRHAPERFPGAEVTSFAARAVPWLERAAHAGLSRTTKALLSGVEARGAVGRRLGRLVAAGDRRPS
ncbi:MAG: hypothetical protein HY907_10740, partial [Deltaproteobacteria bacterium]|nr:hypothetical protein [Deltaproteobacteria bacterium]